MKRKLLAMLLVAAMVLSLTGCLFGGGNDEGVVINLYTGGSDNVRLTWEAVLEAFHEYQSDITVNMHFIPGDMGNVVDTFIASVHAGVETVDMNILDHGEQDLMRILDAAGPGSLVPINASNVPNLAHVTGHLTFGDGVAVGYRGTTVVLAYNSDRVPNPPQTKRELHDWIRANPGRFAYNDPTTGGSGDSFVVTTIYNEMPPEASQSTDPAWKNHWDAGFQVLTDLHPYMYQASGRVLYPARNQGTLDLLAAGEVDIIPAWADMAMQQISHGTLPPSTRIYQPYPPLSGNLQILTIPANTINHEASLAFLNFVVSPRAQELFVTEMHAIPVIPNEMLPQSALDLLGGFQFAEYRVISIGGLVPYLRERWLMEIATLP